MARRSSFLASDADRESVAERLRQAATEGRILAHELEERVATALRARTYGELDALTADLPSSATPARSRGALSLALARSHPVAATLLLVTVTMMLFIMAALVVAGFFAFGGVWVMIAILLFARRGPWSGGRRGGYYGYRSGRYGPGRGRHVHWIP
jgi:hypothetical protein